MLQQGGPLHYDECPHNKEKPRDRHTQTKHYVMMKTEARVMYKPWNAKDCQKPCQKLGKPPGIDSPHHPQED